MASKVKLKKAATIALQDFLGLDPEEVLLIITDDVQKESGIAFYDAARKICEEVYYFEMRAREKHDMELPFAIETLMKNVDVVCIITEKTFTNSEAVKNAASAGIRVGTLPGLTPEAVIRCFTEDQTEIKEATEKLAKLLKGALQVKVTSEAGTDLNFSIEGKEIIQNTGLLRHLGAHGNLLSGEVVLTPVEESMRGTIVFDGSISEYGKIKDPIKLTVTDGKITRVSGKKQANQLEKLLGEVADVDIIGEFGIGTNPNAIITGVTLEDEKSSGVVRFAFGRNLHLGGENEAKMRVLGVMKEASVEVDGDLIVKDGKINTDV